MSGEVPRVVFIDGVRRAPESATVSVFDRGFLYGDSVFEVIRTYGGRPFGLEEHVARLHASAAKLAIDLPWSEAALVAELLVHLADAGFPESYARIVVTRGAGPLGLDPDLATSPTRVVIIQSLTLPAASVYRDGVSVLVSHAPRATDGTAAQGAKASNYLANLLALRDAKRVGAYEPLFVDANDDVLEGGTSNVFLVRGRALLTPPIGRILAGITRRHVIATAPDAGLDVVERDVPLPLLLGADEVFITSTVREIVPVVAVVLPSGERHPIARGLVGPHVRAVHRAFRTRLGAGAAPMPWEA